ncbi:prepilin peptidase [Kocuria oceani]|uniref:Prepilin peptidase n=1 Tax=Kocuria oceani TaxID=988827 RepID=A0ABV9TIH8_9MICC|nr:A24 family peptidase [Kocuria oceani]
MQTAVNAAPLWLLLGSGLAGAALGALLPRVVVRCSPVEDEPRPAPSRLVLAAGTAVLFVLVAAVLGVSWELPAYLFFAAVAVVLTVIDLRHHLLPNAVVLPALGVGFVLLACAAAGQGDWGGLLRAVLGALVLFVLYLVLALISPAGLGMGDVKVAAVLGLFLGYQGWGALFVGAVLASVIGAVVGLAVLASRRGGLRSDVPFGPSMLAGALLAVVVGERMAREYLLPGLY